MHNGVQQQNMPLAGHRQIPPQHDGQQATRILHGIPFSHHILPSGPQALTGYSTGDGQTHRSPPLSKEIVSRPQQTGLRPPSHIPTHSVNSANPSGSGGIPPMLTMSSPQAYHNQNGPPTAPPAHAHRPDARPQYAPAAAPPAPAAQRGYPPPPQLQAALHNTPLTATGSITIPHTQPTVQRAPSQQTISAMQGAQMQGHVPGGHQRTPSQPTQSQNLAPKYFQGFLSPSPSLQVRPGPADGGPSSAQMAQPGAPPQPRPAPSNPQMQDSRRATEVIQHLAREVERHRAQAAQAQAQAQAQAPAQAQAHASQPQPHPQSQPQHQPQSQPQADPVSVPSDAALSQLAIPEYANLRTQQLFEPLRKSFYDTLFSSHHAFSAELAHRLSSIAQRDGAIQQLRTRCDALQNALERERALRERAESDCAEVQRRVGQLEEELRAMREHMPRLLVDFYDVRNQRDELLREVQVLREANGLLREKAAVREGGQTTTMVYEESTLYKRDMGEDKAAVKAEVTSSPPQQPPVVLKVERDLAENGSTAFADHDAEVAQGTCPARPNTTTIHPSKIDDYPALAEERKRRLQAEREAELMRTVIRAAALQNSSTPSDTLTPTPPSTLQPAPESQPEAETKVEPSQADRHASHSLHTEVAPAAPPPASTSASPLDGHTKQDQGQEQEQEQDTAQPSTKVERADDPPMLWTLSESEIIDLTSIIEEVPMQVVPDPSPPRESVDASAAPEQKSGTEPEPERKRPHDDGVATGEGEPGHSPKRRRIMDVIPAQNAMEEGEVPPASSAPVTTPPEDGEVTPISDSAQISTTSNDPSPLTHSPRHRPLQSEPEGASRPPTAPPQPADPTPSLPPRSPSPAPVPPLSPSKRVPPTGILTGLSLPSTSAMVQLPGQQQQEQLPTPTSPFAPPPAPSPPKRLGMRHVPLMYKKFADGRMDCRMCRYVRPPFSFCFSSHSCTRPRTRIWLASPCTH
ncbi:hypothetical protein BV20DRAFT_460160 [Pilatotrama ljubarskyi]|nr:hypothetical protein BV20DRAFT_460160 [Pilatotrama ljubarskyi]